MNKDKIFAQGIRFEKPQEGAPEFIKGRLSFKVSEAVEFLKKHETVSGWVNVDLKKSKTTGKLYLELNTWNPKGDSKPDGYVGLTEEEKAILDLHRSKSGPKDIDYDQDPSGIAF